MMRPSRCGSLQMGHGSCAVRLQQEEQSRTSSRSADKAAARSRAYSGGDFKIWKASRCAVFSPTPGSFAKSTVSRAMGSELISRPRTEPGGGNASRARSDDEGVDDHAEEER